MIDDFVKLRNLEADLIGHIEKITRTFSVPRTKSVLAKAKVSDAIQILSGTRQNDRLKQFDQASKENIVKLVDELGSGRHCVLLLRKEDGSGVVEMITGKEYKFVG